VWYEATQLLYDRAAVRVVMVFELAHAVGCDMLLFTTSNLLWNTTRYQQNLERLDDPTLRMVRTLTQLLRTLQKPLLVLGLGANGFLQPTTFVQTNNYFDLDPTQKLLMEPQAERFAPVYTDFLTALQEYVPTLFVRGAYTEAAVRAHGFPKALGVGCPSLFINPDPFHGLAVEREYALLRARVAAGVDANTFSFMIGLPSYFAPRAWRMTLSILELFPSSVIVVQDDRDLAQLRMAREQVQLSPRLLTLLDERLRYYTSLAAWVRAAHAYDAVFSWRIHGTMAGIAAGVPVLLVTPDLRVQELAAAMLIPHITPFAPALSEQPVRPLDLLAAVRFNGSAWDQHRQRTARIYVDAMRAIGMPPAGAITRIAEEAAGHTAARHIHMDT